MKNPANSVGGDNQPITNQDADDFFHGATLAGSLAAEVVVVEEVVRILIRDWLVIPAN
jgi:hypothetical protein